MPNEAVERQREQTQIDEQYRQATEGFRHPAELQAFYAEADYHHGETEAKAHAKAVADGAHEVEPLYRGNEQAAQGSS